MIYNPLEEYEKKFKNLHQENTKVFFEQLVRQSGVDLTKNRETVRLYNDCRANSDDLRKKRNRLRVLRVFLILSVLLLPVVILKTTPKIRALKEQMDQSGDRAEVLLKEAYDQMNPLNSLFTERDALTIIESTVSDLSFDPSFSAESEQNMKINYDFFEANEAEQSTVDVLSGNYNGNPFLFENRLIHTMGWETYYGSETIHWTETHSTGGKLHIERKSQTLRASVTKPKPFYNTQVVLNYCSQGAPDLYFSRSAGHVETKSESGVERHIKRGEKRLKKLTDQAVASGKDFVSVANADFEVLFNALDRTDEVEYRVLFTPLAQTNMTDLLLSKTGFGDDFFFIKSKRTNRIISEHSQGRPIALTRDTYASYSFDLIKKQFLDKNAEYFKQIYFDFAPLLAIPLYQERPVHSLAPLPDYGQIYSLKECESLANYTDSRYVAHPSSKTPAILKSEFVSSQDGIDEIRISAYSYDIANRVDHISVRGDDGYWHDVPVYWDEYLPLTTSNKFYVSKADGVQQQNIVGVKDGLCLFQ